eukprot:SAG11_NODE_11410_length_762_cov_2.701357_2_plen_90_part_01
MSGGAHAAARHPPLAVFCFLLSVCGLPIAACPFRWADGGGPGRAGFAIGARDFKDGGRSASQKITVPDRVPDYTVEEHVRQPHAAAARRP